MARPHKRGPAVLAHGEPCRNEDDLVDNLENSDAEASWQVWAPSTTDLDVCIEAAEAYEQVLARKQYRLRKLTLNLIAYRDALQEFGKAVWEEVMQ
jgi:hypothetical protein